MNNSQLWKEVRTFPGRLNNQRPAILGHGDKEIATVKRGVGMNAYVPKLTSSAGIAWLVRKHPGYRFASTKQVCEMTGRFVVTTRDPIIEIAADSGFQSLSRFKEAFKLACGFEKPSASKASPFRDNGG